MPMPENLVPPDDDPGNTVYFTIREVEETIRKFLGPDLSAVTCKMLKDGDPVEVNSEFADWTVRFEPAGTGLYRAYVRGQER
jgi:hypothetical protein